MSENENEVRRVDIPIRWPATIEIPTTYANHVYITHAGKEFYLVFGELNVPVLLNTPEADLPEYVEVKPLIKIAMTPETMAEFVQTINTNYGAYLSKQIEQENEEDE